MLVVSAVGWLWAAGELHRALTAYAEPAALLRIYSLAQTIAHFYTPTFRALHNKPPYSITSESKQVRITNERFHLADVYMRVLHTD